MYDAIPDLKKFVDRNKHRPYKDFLQDAVRFSYKVYGYCHINNIVIMILLWVLTQIVYFTTLCQKRL